MNPIFSMAPIHPQQPRQGYLVRLTYLALFTAIIFTFTTVIFAKAAAQKLLNRHSIYDKLATKNFLSGLFTTKRNQKLEAAFLASLLGQTDKPMAKRSTTDDNDTSQEAWKFSTNKWIRHSPRYIKPPRKLANWKNKLPDHLEPSRPSRIWMQPLPCLP